MSNAYAPTYNGSNKGTGSYAAEPRAPTNPYSKPKSLENSKSTIYGYTEASILAPYD